MAGLLCGTSWVAAGKSTAGTVQPEDRDADVTGSMMRTTTEETVPERTEPDASVPTENRAVRALSSAARAEVLRSLRHEGPQRVEQLAERLGRHVNTVRGHLEILRDADLVTASPQEPDGPGRPPMVYAATVEAEHPYQILADTLAASLHQGVSIADRAEAWGRRLGAAARLEDDDLADAVARLLRRLGFDACPVEEPSAADEGPGAGGDAAPAWAPRLEVHGCPFADTVAESGAVVCSIQEHLLRGAVEVMGGDPEGVSVQPDREQGICAVRLGHHQDAAHDGAPDVAAAS